MSSTSTALLIVDSWMTSNVGVVFETGWMPALKSVVRSVITFQALSPLHLLFIKFGARGLCKLFGSD